MKLLSLFLIVKVVAATSWRGPPRRSATGLTSWFIDDNVKDAAGCNSSWSSADTVQTLQTRHHRIFIDTVRHGGSTGDSRNVCVYKPPQVKRKRRKCNKGPCHPRGKRFGRRCKRRCHGPFGPRFE